MTRPTFSYVRSVVWLDEVESTSDHARRLLDQSELPARSLVWADRQTRGRGQGSNAWWSDAGSLTTTLVIDPADHGLTIAHGPRVALTVALTIVEAIRSLYPTCDPGIRWPNDVEVNGRKLGGLLTEWVESADGPRILVGIGLNVRTRLDEAPTDVQRLAGSLADWETEPLPGDPRIPLLEAILSRMTDGLDRLVREAPNLVQSWNQVDTLAGSPVRIQVGNEIVEGNAEGIDDRGGLRIRVDGQSRVLHAGRVLRDL